MDDSRFKNARRFCIEPDGVRLGVYYIMTTRTGGGQHNITEDGCMEGNWGQNAAQSHGTMPLGEGS